MNPFSVSVSAAVSLAQPSKKILRELLRHVSIVSMKTAKEKERQSASVVRVELDRSECSKA